MDKEDLIRIKMQLGMSEAEARFDAERLERERKMNKRLGRYLKWYMDPMFLLIALILLILFFAWALTTIVL